MPLFKVVQKEFGFLSGQETQPFIVSLYHLPGAALGGQGIDAVPHAGGDSMVYGGANEAEYVVHGLFGQSFPFPRLGVGLSCGFFGLCIPGGCLQELRLETGEQIRGQLDNGQSMNFVLEVGVILTVVLVNVFPFAPAPFKIGIHQVPDGDFIPHNGVDASGPKLGKEFCPLLSGRRTDALAVSADGFPVPLTLVVCVPEAVDFLVFMYFLSVSLLI